MYEPVDAAEHQTVQRGRHMASTSRKLKGGGQNRSGVCYEVGETVCLNFQGSKSNNATAQDGTAFGLCAMHGHDVHAVCYAIGQQGGKNNAGYAEGVMMTLLSDSHGTPHGVCYVLEGNTVDREAKQNGRGWCEDVSPTLNAQDKHALAFTIERPRRLERERDQITVYPVQDHPQDSRVTIEDDITTVQTLNAKMGTGGATHL